MDLLTGHQPLKILLISFMFIIINGDVLRLQPVTLPTFTIPTNVSTSDLVAANKIKIIGNDIINNEIIEKGDKDIIRIQSILPKFNRTYNKRKRIRNPLVNNRDSTSESKIVNVGNFLKPIIISTQLPITFPKRSPQLNTIPEQTENIQYNSLRITTTAIPPVKVGPYLYERPNGQPFEIENKFNNGEIEIVNTEKPLYLNEYPNGNQFDEIKNNFNYDGSYIPTTIKPIYYNKYANGNQFEFEDRFSGYGSYGEPESATTKKPTNLYEKPNGNQFEIEDNFNYRESDIQTTKKPKYLYEKPTGNPFDIEDRFGQDIPEPTIITDSKYDTHPAAPSEVEPIIIENYQTEIPRISSTVADTNTTTMSTPSPTEKHMLSSTSTTAAPSTIEPIINKTVKPIISSITTTTTMASSTTETKFPSSTQKPILTPTTTATSSKLEPRISKTTTVEPMLNDAKPAFVQISGGNGKFDIRTLRVLKPNKRKHRKKMRKNRKMMDNKNILDNEIVNIKVN